MCVETKFLPAFGLFLLSSAGVVVLAVVAKKLFKKNQETEDYLGGQRSERREKLWID
tara:strand:- start:177 stop:347 length:171 start_codon:yes stop_codon:yes gene_type:complete